MQKTKKINIYILAVIVIIFAFCKMLELLLQDANYMKQQTIILTVAILVYLFLLLSIRKASKKINIFFVYIFLGFFFAFGQHLLLVVWRINCFNQALLENSIIKAGYWHIYAALFTCLGYFIVPQENKVSKGGCNDKIVKCIATLFSCISIVPYVLQAISNIMITKTSGYGYRIVENNNNASLIGILSGFCLPAITLLYFSVKGKAKKYLLILIVLCLGMQLLAGTRIASVCYLVVLTYWKYTEIDDKRKKMKFCIAGGILGVAAISLFSMISYDRSALSNVRNLADLIHHISSYNEHGTILKSVLEEVGSNFQVLACAIQNCPQNVKYNYGYSYLYSIVYIVPNALTRFFFPVCVNTDSALAHFLVPYGGIGSSFAAEAYYNFGQGGLIYLVIWGMIWRVLCNYMKRVRLNDNIVEAFVAFEISIEMIFTVRSDVVYLLRNLVWNVGVIVFVIYIVNNVIRNSKISS